MRVVTDSLQPSRIGLSCVMACEKCTMEGARNYMHHFSDKIWLFRTKLRGKVVVTISDHFCRHFRPDFF